MKHIFTLTLLLSFSTVFSQWTRVQQLPSSDIFSLYSRDGILYAGGNRIVYLSRDSGQTWDSTNVIPLITSVDNIIVFKNELFVSSFSTGVLKSADGGNTWQNISTGLFPEVSDFSEWRGDLYASTLGSSMFKLEPVNRNSWLSFSNGLSSLSSNNTSLAGNNNALIAGTLANGMYDHLPANSTTWEERFLLGQIRATEGVYDIITAHDSLILSGSTGRYYLSTDNGLNWNTFGNILPSLNTSLSNARQAFVLSRIVFDGLIFHSSFHYIKKDSLQNSFVSFSVVPDHFTYKIAIHGGRLWDASNVGLFYMPLANLPGISADDSGAVVLPVRFVSFKATCESNRLFFTWKTVQELNSSHFNIERSTDGISWAVIGSVSAAGTSVTGRVYSFADNNPPQNGFYRLAEYDLDGRIQFTETLRASCTTSDLFNAWPNPVRDILYINISTAHESPALIRIFDSKGSLVRNQKTVVQPGQNRVIVNMSSLARGIYTLNVNWNNGQFRKTVQVVNQQ